MPQSSPTGGLSLLIHIMLNVAVFTYNKIVEITGASKKNWVSNSFDKLTNKDGDSYARQLLSYALVMFVLIVMSSNFVLLTVKLFKLQDVRLSSKIEEVIASRYTNAVSDVVSEETNSTPTNTTESDSTSYENLSYEVIDTEITDNTYTSLRITDDSLDSLVYLMTSLGLVDTSFEARAELAKKFDVVEFEGQYDNLPSQNRQIIQSLQ